MVLVLFLDISYLADTSIKVDGGRQNEAWIDNIYLKENSFGLGAVENLQCRTSWSTSSNRSQTPQFTWAE